MHIRVDDEAGQSWSHDAVRADRVPVPGRELQLHSSAYEWLVVSGCKAQYKGTGKVNGAGNYGFLLTAADGNACTTPTADKFRIKIWNRDTGATVYDNAYGSAEDMDSANPQAIASGSIVIHAGSRRLTRGSAAHAPPHALRRNPAQKGTSQ